MTDPQRPDIAIHDLFSANAYFGWGMKGVGFGQLSFSLDRETGRLSCMNECMSRERVRALLHAFADHVADNVILEETWDDVSPASLTQLAPRELLQTAVLWAYADPAEGGYADGPDVDTLSEELGQHVQAWTGLVPDEEWRTEEETLQQLEQVQVPHLGEHPMEAPAQLLRALLLWAHCPVQGGYREGCAVEDTCEALQACVEQWTGVAAPDAQLTVDEVKQMTASLKLFDA